MVSIGVCVPVIYSLKYEETDTSKQCYTDFNVFNNSMMTDFIYYSLLTVITSVLPLFTLIIVYVMAIQALRFDSLKDRNIATRIRMEENKRIVIMFIVVVIFFMVLTIPYAIHNVIYTYYAYYDEEKINTNLELFLQLNYYMDAYSSLNNCINPFIYSRMHKVVRKYCLHVKRKFSRIFHNKYKRQGTIATENSTIVETMH